MCMCIWGENHQDFWVTRCAAVLLVFLFFFSFCIYLFVWLCHVLVASSGIFSCGMRDLFPDQGSNPEPLHQKCGVSATGPPEKSLLTLSQYSLFSCLSWAQKTLGFSPQRRGSLSTLPRLQMLEGLGAQSSTLFLSLCVSLGKLIHFCGSKCH